MAMTFEHWMDEIDKIVRARIGVSVHDLPDRTYRDAYNDEVSPREAAADILSDPDMF